MPKQPPPAAELTVRAAVQMPVESLSSVCCAQGRTPIQTGTAFLVYSNRERVSTSKQVSMGTST
jgi:hypothetical protein